MIESVSRRAFSGSSGTYNVRASELARDRRLKTLSATVVFLDDTQHVFQIDKRAKGQALLDLVFQHLELVERDYFGLEFADASSNGDAIMRWLDASKPVKRQQHGAAGSFFFRVKFYVSDPSKLTEEYTRYHLYLQVRRDILAGRLRLPVSAAILLASYSVQSELGDWSPDEHGNGYLSGLALLPGQTAEIERKVSELHKLHRGQTPADAEFNYLDHAKRLDMYGVDLHRARDNGGKEIQLGVASVGLVIIKNAVRINTFSWSKVVKISFKRKQFFIQLRRELSESCDTLLGFNLPAYRASKSLWKSCVEHHTFFRLHSPHVTPRRFHLTLGSRFAFSGRTEFQTVEEGRHRARLERTFVRSPSKRIARPAATEDKGKPPPPTTAPAPAATARAARPYEGRRVTSLGAREPRRAWTDPALPSDDEGGFGTERSAFAPSARAMSYADEDDERAEAPDDETNTYEPAAYDEDTVVCVTIEPDAEGRFGFNVKGGSELRAPVLVSRVAPNTPADRCLPRLSEGDQVLRINGACVDGLAHEQVVALIRASRDEPPGTLTLAIRPNALYDGGRTEEPPYEYVPELPAPGSTNPGSALDQSMLLLADGLASGALVAQFELLYRKNPGMTAAESKQHAAKNRYRDISPYDATRVILMAGANGDYINANYVTMEIPGSGVVNRYIATQGPLANTVADFWQMVLEAGSTLIVMVTPLAERGRAKCHRYWPPVGETLEAARLSVQCETEATRDGFVYRELALTDTESGERRHVTHMQYTAWPDHGVPDDPAQFAAFAGRVRAARAGSAEPTVVHCSAGIGRTGVLILMETAVCLVEAGQPVYPLDIVRTMRDQRAMMIQTAGQYRFVCESVHRAYADGVVKPLPEFQPS